MDIAYWVGLGVALLGGGFLKDAAKWIIDSIKGRNEYRRGEVSRALAERDKARAERDSARDAALSEISWYQTWTRILDEALVKLRRTAIGAGLQVDEYPTQPPRD